MHICSSTFVSWKMIEKNSVKSVIDLHRIVLSLLLGGEEKKALLVKKLREKHLLLRDRKRRKERDSHFSFLLFFYEHFSCPTDIFSPPKEFRQIEYVKQPPSR